MEGPVTIKINFLPFPTHPSCIDSTGSLEGDIVVWFATMTCQTVVKLQKEWLIVAVIIATMSSITQSEVLTFEVSQVEQQQCSPSGNLTRGGGTVLRAVVQVP